jgi:hypothetical protein
MDNEGYGNIFLVGSDWEPFFFGAQKIRAKLGVSHGVSHRMLRELCASGDVRAVLVTYHDGHNHPIRRIKPSEWRTTELDIHDDDLHDEEGEWVEVSMDDVERWIEQQEPEAAPEPAHRETPQKKWVGKAFDALWEGKPPLQDLPNSDLVSRVDTWIAAECKSKNLRKPSISPDTILRHAGRKK